MEDTWALRGAPGRLSIEIFLQTPFLNLDAVAAEWKHGKREWLIHENGFWDGVSSRILDINHEPNPNPVLCAIRAIAVARANKIRFSCRLARFTADHIGASSDGDLHLLQCKHYGNPSIMAVDFRRIVTHLKRQLDSGAGVIDPLNGQRPSSNGSANPAASSSR
jgi:hypothetical protein